MSKNNQASTKPSREKQQQITTMMPPSLLRILDEIATAEGTSRARIINRGARRLADEFLAAKKIESA